MCRGDNPAHGDRIEHERQRPERQIGKATPDKEAHDVRPKHDQHPAMAGRPVLVRQAGTSREYLGDACEDGANGGERHISLSAECSNASIPGWGPGLVSPGIGHRTPLSGSPVCVLAPTVPSVLSRKSRCDSAAAKLHRIWTAGRKNNRPGAVSSSGRALHAKPPEKNVRDRTPGDAFALPAHTLRESRSQRDAAPGVESRFCPRRQPDASLLSDGDAG